MPDHLAPSDPTSVLRSAMSLALREEQELRGQYAECAGLVAPSSPDRLRYAALAALAHGRAIGFAVALAAIEAAQPSPTASAEPGLVLAAATLMALSPPDAHGNAGSLAGPVPECVAAMLDV